MAALNYSDAEAMAEATMAWRDATADVRKAIFEAEYEKAYKAIEADRKKRGVKQGMTHTQTEKARRQAKAKVTAALYKMKAHNGVSNPVAADPVWGHDSEAAEEQKAAKAPTPNKYAGACADCGQWVEANAGTITKRNGKWASLHIGECPKAQPRPNSYAGQCGTCGGEVQPKEGRIEKADGRWVTFHLDGQCPEQPEAPTGLDLSGLVPGYYAVPNGDTRLKLAISHGKKGGKWEGYSFVKDGAEYGSQERYGMQRPGQPYRGKVQDALEAILEDPKAAMVAYGKLVGRCGACGAILEDENSVAAGIGPICAQKWEG